ncbi:MAG: hypothetical protein QM790_02055 [Nibricoccus sp.]
MELQLQPLATACHVSGQPFVEGNRVASHLVSLKTGEIMRYDLLETESGEFTAEGTVVCRWVQVFKPRRANENPDRALKLTAETLFITLADPTAENSPENTRLVQFLALMLERKRVLKPKGRTADGARNIFEHAKTKQLFEVPVGELTPEFFVQVQAQLGMLVGEPKQKPDTPTASPTSTSPATT